MDHNQAPRSASNPEQRAERTGPVQQRDTDDEQADVERFLGDDVVPDLGRFGSEFVDG